MLRVDRLAFLLTLGLALGGCGKPALPPPEAAPRAPEGPLTVGTGVGQLAPEIEGEDLDGKKFKLSDFRGKVVVLDFWRRD